MDFIVFNETVVLDQFFKFLAGLEEIMNSIHFAFARLAGGSGNGILDIGKIRQDHLLQGGLTSTTGGTHNEKFVVHIL